MLVLAWEILRVVSILRGQFHEAANILHVKMIVLVNDAIYKKPKRILFKHMPLSSCLTLSMFHETGSRQTCCFNRVDTSFKLIAFVRYHFNIPDTQSVNV